MSISVFPGAAQRPVLPLADRLAIALDAVLDKASESPMHQAEALAEAALHVYGLKSQRKSWSDDALALAELIKAVGFVADSGVGGPCAIPPGTVLGAKPRALRIATDDRGPDHQGHQVYDETNGWGG